MKDLKTSENCEKPDIKKEIIKNILFRLDNFYFYYKLISIFKKREK